MSVANKVGQSKTLITAAILIFLAVVLFFVYKNSETVPFVKEDSYPVTKHFKWRYKLVNESSETLQSTRFKVAAPSSLLANQKLVELQASLPYEKETDELGNTNLVFTLGAIAPYATTYVDIKAQLNFAVKPQAFTDELADIYLQPSYRIESDHAGVIHLAQSLSKADKIETLKSQYDWIKDNLEYSGYVKEDMGALYAVEHKKGDCTEYSYLMAALARASDIPARVMGGYVYAENSVVKSMDYHNWTEVWLDGRWYIIDPQKERFMRNYQDYLTVKEISLTNTTQSNSHQITISEEALKVTL